MGENVTDYEREAAELVRQAFARAGEGNELWRLRSERDAARAEVARLRETVERVRAIADDALAAGTAPPDDPCDYRDEHDCHAVARYFVAERIHAALAPVEPSGAKSVEVDVCSMCGHAVLDLPEGGFRHVDSRLDLSHPIKLAPAPVSSGGQADGEPLTVDKLKELLRIAARPVLSREALEERIVQHLDEVWTDDPCWQSKPDSVTWGRWTRRRARHLADVLAGEQ